MSAAVASSVAPEAPEVLISLDSVDFVELRWVLEDKHRVSRATAIELVEKFRRDGKLAAEYVTDAQALAQGMPVAYVIGWIDFLGCRIDLSLRPLIPRPETEFWVEQFIAAERLRNLNRKKPLRVLDLCCGSGCVGIAVLSQLPNVHVTSVDIDPKMVEQTELNLHGNHIPDDRYSLITSDLFSGVDGRFDVILTNPPYVDAFGDFSPSLSFEPPLSLFAQNNGHAFIDQIFSKAKNHINSDGQMYIEFAANQGNRVQEMAVLSGWNFRVFQDHFARDRFGICTLISSKSPTYIG